MGTILGFVLAFLAYCLIYKVSWSAEVQQKIYLFMLLPPVLGYALVPFGSGIREKIYYKFYELGNNGLYVPSVTEMVEEEQTEGDGSTGWEEINVEG